MHFSMFPLMARNFHDTGPSGLTCTLLFHQNLACGFNEARLFFEWVTSPGYLPDPSFRTVRFLFPQPYVVEAFQHQQPESGFLRLPDFFTSDPDSYRRRIVDGLRVANRRFFHQPFHTPSSDIQIHGPSGLASVHPSVPYVHHVSSYRFGEVPTVLSGMADRVAPQAPVPSRRPSVTDFLPPSFRACAV